MIELRRVLPAVVLALWLVPAPVRADAPAAGMVVTVIGATDPALADGAEIPVGEPVHVGHGAYLTFLHYAKCKLVTVTDATVTLSPGDYRSDGKIDSEKNGPCPRVHQLSGAAAGATSGALVMRGMPVAMRLSTSPEFVFAGSRADKVTGAEIYADETPPRLVARLGLAARRATLGRGIPPLTINTRYILRVAMSDQATPLELEFVGSPPSAGGSLVVLRVD